MQKSSGNSLEVSLKESLDSGIVLLDVSEEIARERGFPSPKKKQQLKEKERQLLLEKEKSLLMEKERSEALEYENRLAAAVKKNLAEEMALAAKNLADEVDQKAVPPRNSILKDEVKEEAPESPIEKLMLSVALDDESPSSTLADKSPERRRQAPKSALSPERQRRERGGRSEVAFLDFQLTAEQKRQQYFRSLGKMADSTRSRDFERSYKSEDDSNLQRPSVTLSRVSKLLQKMDGTSSSMASDQHSTASLFSPSYSQDILFRNMKEFVPKTARSRVSSASSSSMEAKEKARLRSSVERLAHPKTSSSSNAKRDTYARYDEQKNCVFQPKIVRRSSEASGDSGSNTSAFLERQEAAERSRRLEHEFAIGKAKYDALVDKRLCPSCKNKQSYDEVKEKRKTCPNCKLEYVYAVDWGKASSSFFRRVKDFAAKQDKNREDILMEMLSEFRFKKKVFNPETHRMEMKNIDPLKSIVWTKELEEEFFERLDDFIDAKKKNITRIEEETYGETCTFRPSVRRNKRNGEEDDVDEESPNLFEAFLERMELDLERRLEERKSRDEERTMEKWADRK